MHPFALFRLGRWTAAASIAAAAVTLTARDSRAHQMLFSYLDVSNTSCLTDANGNYYVAEAVAFTAGGGAIACTSGQSAEIVSASGVGSTAQATCDFGGRGTAVTQGVTVISQDGQGGIQAQLCASSVASFTSTTTCSFTPAVHGGCGSGNSFQAVSFGQNY
jgi:hypothetical protein